MIPPYGGKERNVTGNELGNLKEYALFNLVEDPAQLNNVAAQNPEVLEELKQRLAAQTDGQVRNGDAPAAPKAKDHAKKNKKGKKASKKG